jgi:hypothetical protein
MSGSDGRMRVAVADGTSPIFALARGVAESIVLIAPENIAQAKSLIAGLTLVITDETAECCAISVESKRIVLSRRLLEHLWCSAYAYWVLYSRYVSGRNVTEPEEIDLTADRDTHDAMRLLTWSIHAAADGHPWPAGLPRPSSNPDASDAHVANELMLCAAAFLLHHELSHYRLLHSPLPPGPDSIDQEREADYEAARWVLAGCQGDIFDKRVLGTMIALVVLVARAIHRGGPEQANDHPRSFDRLINTLRRHLTDPHHAAWGMAVIAIKLHLDHAGVAVHPRAYPDAQTAAEDFADVLSADSDSRRRA